MRAPEREAQHCPLCGLPLTYIAEGDFGMYGNGTEIIIPLAAEIWECHLHRQFRIYINGKIERVDRSRN